MAKKATQAKLDGLHDLLATYYTELLEEGDELSSGTLAAINTFLKNNNVTADIVESTPMQNMQYKLNTLLQEAN